MYDDMNFLAFIIGILLLFFIIYKYKYNYNKHNNKLLNDVISELPMITRYYL
jgi:hypothetical protein